MSRNAPRTRARARATLRLSRREPHTRQRLNQPRHIADAIFLLTDRGYGAHLLAVPFSRNPQPGTGKMRGRLSFFIKCDRLIEVTFRAIGISQWRIEVNVVWIKLTRALPV